MDAIFASLVVAVIALALLAVYIATGKKDREEGGRDLTLLGGTEIDSDAHGWISELQDEGIWAEIRPRGEPVAGDLTVIDTASSNWKYEVWVRLSDLDRARELLGLRPDGLN